MQMISVGACGGGGGCGVGSCGGGYPYAYPYVGQAPPPAGAPAPGAPAPSSPTGSGTHHFRFTFPWWAFAWQQPWYGFPQSNCYFHYGLGAWVCPPSPLGFYPYGWRSMPYVPGLVGPWSGYGPGFMAPGMGPR